MEHTLFLLILMNKSLFVFFRQQRGYHAFKNTQNKPLCRLFAEKIPQNALQAPNKAFMDLHNTFFCICHSCLNGAYIMLFSDTKVDTNLTQNWHKIFIIPWKQTKWKYPCKPYFTSILTPYENRQNSPKANKRWVLIKS